MRVEGEYIRNLQLSVPSQLFGSRYKTMVTRPEMRRRRNDCSTNNQPQILFIKGRISFIFLITNVLWWRARGSHIILVAKEINKAFFSKHISKRTGDMLLSNCRAHQKEAWHSKYCHISTCQITILTESGEINYYIYKFWGIIDSWKLLTHNNVIQDFQTSLQQ